MPSTKTLLITGASGFLGTWLGEKAFQEGYMLFGIGKSAPARLEIWAGYLISTCENANFGHLLNGYSLNAVCHLAGGASVANSLDDPYGDFSKLLPGTTRLALYISKYHPGAKFVFFSSAAVYGNPVILPIREEIPVCPISPYGVHKATAENILSHYSRIFGLLVISLRIFSVYGPGLRKQLMWDVSHRVLSAVKQGRRSITLFGTGKESRDFIYVTDVCRATLQILDRWPFEEAGVINIASGMESQIEEVALKIINNLNCDTHLQFDGQTAKGNPANWQADVSLLKEIGFTPAVTLDCGLREVTQWILDNQ